MHTPHRPAAAGSDAFSIAELESRFEMEALHVAPLAGPSTDWSCTCTLQF